MTVVTNDDVAVPNSTWSTGRRGVAGTLVVEKIVGAGAEQSMALAGLAGARPKGERPHALVRRRLDPVHRAGRRQADVRARPPTKWKWASASTASPAVGAASWASADAIAEEMLGAILGDLAPPAGSECLLLVNGFGGTPLMELYLMVNAARRILAGRGLDVARHLTGSLVTSLDMAGCSLTVSLLDERLIRLWDAPVKTAALSW